MASPSLPSSSADYLAAVRRRARSSRPGSIATRSASEPTVRSRGARSEAVAAANRYTALAAPRPLSPAGPASDVDRAADLAASRPASVGAAQAAAPIGTDDAPQTLPISLKDEFDRVRDDQGRIGAPRRRRLRSRRALILLGVPGLLLTIAAVILVPIAFRGARAYQKVFVPQAPHETSQFVPQKQPDGTRVIVTAAAPAPAIIPPWDGKERLTILLLGVDRREQEASRSDTMILVNIDPVTKQAAMMAIPRDLKVIVPGYGVHKINAAYAFGDVNRVAGGGPGLSIRTIEANFGIRVDYFAEVDFNGFIKIVDTLGGVTMDVPYPIKDDAYPGHGNQYMRIFFKPGWQRMDGGRVLQYSRTRHDDGDGRRSVRQQQVLLALRQQAVNLDLLPKAAELVTELGDAVRTDLQPAQALQLARLASEIDPGRIRQISLDAAMSEQQLPDQPYFLIADWDAAGSIMSDFMGKTITPPMSALAHPGHDIPIRIEDGTLNPGLGERIAGILRINGFTNIAVVNRSDAGRHPTTSVTTSADNLTTAYLIAGLIGAPFEAIDASAAAESAVSTDPVQT
ncbi:MAG: LCP family protein, partial [Thermomicrobiales bacterium]